MLGTHGRLGASYLDKNKSLLRLANLCSLSLEILLEVHRLKRFKLGCVLFHKVLFLLGKDRLREVIGDLGLPNLLNVTLLCGFVRRVNLALENVVNIDVGEPRMLQDSLVAVLAITEPGRGVLVT